MRGNSFHGNRDIPRVPDTGGVSGRPEKGDARASGMHARGKSDGRIVPEKPTNNGATHAPAEPVEGRRPTEGNGSQTAAHRTQRRACASIGLRRVREVAHRDGRARSGQRRCPDGAARFTALLHHVDVGLLRESYYALKRHVSPGVDGLTWGQYEDGSEERLRDLHDRVHRGSYRAQPSRRAWIPKPDGRMRPLGVAALEDKIVEQALVTVLNTVYEEDFLGFSYGFGPGRSAHDALDALWVGIVGKKVNWVLDADIRGFFDTIDHGWMIRFLEHRIADRRVLRLVRKWLRAGVSEDGIWSKTEVGTPQGAVISPLLANVYLHYVLDLWVERWRRKFATGDVIIVRYADDFVMGFQHRHEAERFLKELQERMHEFGLALHPEKTRLIEFGRFAASNREERGDGKPETFDFLGFTHSCGKKRVSGRFTVRRKTVRKRMRAKLREIREALFRRLHEPVRRLGAWLRSVVQGYFNYHAIHGNMDTVRQFFKQVTRHWLRALRRRSQNPRMPWTRFQRIVERWLPHARVLHPYPNVRFFAKHPR